MANLPQIKSDELDEIAQRSGMEARNPAAAGNDAVEEPNHDDAHDDDDQNLDNLLDGRIDSRELVQTPEQHSGDQNNRDDVEKSQEHTKYSLIGLDAERIDDERQGKNAVGGRRWQDWRNWALHALRQGLGFGRTAGSSRGCGCNERLRENPQALPRGDAH